MITHWWSRAQTLCGEEVRPGTQGRERMDGASQHGAWMRRARRGGAHPVMASVSVSPGSAPSGTTTCSVRGPNRAGGHRCQAGHPDNHPQAAKAPERVRLLRHGACTAPAAGRGPLSLPPPPSYPPPLEQPPPPSYPPPLQRGATFIRCPACVVSVMMSPGCASVGTTTW